MMVTQRSRMSSSVRSWKGRERLVRIVEFLYPQKLSWSSDPQPILGRMFPLKKLVERLEAFPQLLSEIETKLLTALKN